MGDIPEWQSESGQLGQSELGQCVRNPRLDLTKDLMISEVCSVRYAASFLLPLVSMEAMYSAPLGTTAVNPSKERLCHI